MPEILQPHPEAFVSKMLLVSFYVKQRRHLDTKGVHPKGRISIEGLLLPLV